MRVIASGACGIVTICRRDRVIGCLGLGPVEAAFFRGGGNPVYGGLLRRSTASTRAFRDEKAMEISSLRSVVTPWEERKTELVKARPLRVGRIFLTLRATLPVMTASWMVRDHMTIWSSHQLLSRRLFSKQSTCPLLTGPWTIESAP